MCVCVCIERESQHKAAQHLTATHSGGERGLAPPYYSHAPIAPMQGRSAFAVMARPRAAERLHEDALPPEEAARFWRLPATAIVGSLLFCFARAVWSMRGLRSAEV